MSPDELNQEIQDAIFPPEEEEMDVSDEPEEEEAEEVED